MLKVTIEELRALNPCDLDARLALFGRRKALTVTQAVEAGATVEDILWVAGRLGHKERCVRFAVACARRVAHLNPDPRVKTALDATDAWLADPTPENAKAAAEAAAEATDAAWVAVWAADAADAAASVAAAARAAAEAAADAAAEAAADAAPRAADAAAWAAVWAAWAARAEEKAAQVALLLEIFA